MKQVIYMRITSPSMKPFSEAVGRKDKQWKHDGVLCVIKDWNNMGNGSIRIVLEEISL